MSDRLGPARTLVTGGAGFIGGELVESLLADGADVTVVDNLTTSSPDWAERFAGQPHLTLVEADATDAGTLDQVMKGRERIIHLAAGTDVAGGFQHPERDYVNGIAATHVVCEAMRRNGIGELWFASSGVVYGSPAGGPSSESDGALLPESHYAAAKLAGEAIISGFAHLYGWRSLVFRFGNTVGARSDHGVVHDLVVKLLRDPRRLEILGDGNQAKPYVAVDDLVAGMRHAAAVAPSQPVTTLNLGPEGSVPVRRVAELVIDALGIPPASVELSYTGRSGSAGGGWPGDTALVEFDTGAIRALGWSPRRDSEATIHDAAVGIALSYRTTGRRLLTAAERRAKSDLAMAEGSA
ncbi:MAG: NAD-dependent epimerase/dehydratase family protein [Chloroflexota bacterium]